MNNLLVSLYLQVAAALTGIRNRAANEVSRLRSDERGMELIQLILIIMIVIVAAVLVWTFLGDYIQGLFDQIDEHDIGILGGS